eukprot:TRINITY_DN46908_c0_g1_i1.p1 TRINITY_DN46908_c0_g1~~TRINITY_DN46908_c0_g1_i1.p1  ORF type:complete len:1101 (+),score=372.64 TRINITY_DN46908_c0_g1_i1:110-3412(+)
MADVLICQDRFKRRVGRLVASWTWDFDALLILSGETEEVAATTKTDALHFWLLGVQFPDCAFIIQRSGEVTALCSEKKLGYLREMGAKINFLARPAGVRGLAPENIPALDAAIRGGREATTVGMLLGEERSGQFNAGVMFAVKSMAGVKVVECASSMSNMLLPKEAEELELIRKAAMFTQDFYKTKFSGAVEQILDDALECTNVKLCENMLEAFDTDEVASRCANFLNLDSQELELGHVTLQSGANYELAVDVTADDSLIPMQGTYLLSLAAKYMLYGAVVARTLLVDPQPLWKEAYKLALKVQEHIVGQLQPGAVFKDIYASGVNVVKETNPALLELFADNVGWALGVEFCDEENLIDATCEQKVLPNMALCVSVGFVGAATKEAPAWAVWLCDTVVLKDGRLEVLTTGAEKRLQQVLFELTAEDAPPVVSKPPPPAAVPTPTPAKTALKATPAAAAVKAAPKAKGKAKAKEKAATLPIKVAAKAAAPKPQSKQNVPVPPRTARAAAPPAPMQRNLRSKAEETKQEISAQMQMEDQMKQLRAAMHEEMAKRLAEGGVAAFKKGGALTAGPKKLADCRAYKSVDDMPAGLRGQQVQMDLNAQALLVPIAGAIVPFHARTIKNMSRNKTDSGDGREKHYLRVNFFAPGQGKSYDDYPAPTVNGNRVFVREFTFRSSSVENFDRVERQFKEVLKQIKDGEIAREVNSNANGQAEPLQPLRQFPCLRDLNMRPTFGTSARRTVGTLEAHTNGFRFISRSDKVDIMYSQIKHVIYEPCEKQSLIVILHLHLKAPMMLGKKKTQDIQFFAEVAPQTEDLSQARAGNIHDPDEILEEQREREMKERVNKVFKEFAEKVEKIPTCPLKVDIPFTEALSFSGVPLKSSVALVACAHALVGLQEWPPFVLSTDDIELAVFERAEVMSLREFDIVFLKKNYDEPPVRITTIPSRHLNMLKMWLVDMKIVWYTTGVNMHWQAVLKEVTRDFKQFLEDGGWEAWLGNMANSEEEADDSEDGDEDWNDVNSDDEEDVADADADDDFDVDESESDDGEEDLSEEGMDWDELEDEAEEQDRRKVAEIKAMKREAKEPAAKASKRPPAKKARRTNR